MRDYKHYLDKFGEIGYVEELVHSVCYVSGLPHVHPKEVVVFENNALGEILSLTSEYAEVLLLTSTNVKVGFGVARTDELVKIGVGTDVLGKAIDPLGKSFNPGEEISYESQKFIDSEPPRLMEREEVKKPLETGVGIVDMVVPLAKGQRELVIGDRKTGKSQFILQTILYQAQKGTICIYAVIGQRHLEIGRLREFFKEKGILGNTIIVATSSSDPAGLIFLTPYTATTLAEYFRDKGMDVLLILDDLTTHARYYREISLLARRFPGRSSYPGDIFYVHSRLMERAGNFKKGSITCLPSAESILGDLSGYIQTNIMAMTDGHVFFDIELYNQGQRPAVNPFLSVTRVGHQAQTPLKRDVSRELSSFLVQHDKMREFMHFGAEVGENVRKILDKGEKLSVLFDQPSVSIIPINLNILLIGALWAGVWNDVKKEVVAEAAQKLLGNYQANEAYRKNIDQLVESCDHFSDLVNALRQNEKILMTDNQ